MKCSGPTHCKYCGSQRKRDAIGHYCPTTNCKWRYGYAGCTLHKKDKGREMSWVIEISLLVRSSAYRGS